MLIQFLPRRLRKRLVERPTLENLANALLWLLLSCALFVVFFKVTETAEWDESLWQMWQTVTTVGYGNKPAATLPGRLTTMVFGVLGIAFLGVTISSWFDWRNDLRERRLMGELDNPFRNGYIIINFPGNGKFITLATELVADAAEERTAEICIIDSQLERLPTAILHLPRVKVHFLRGSLLSETTYRRAKVAENKTILIFPQQAGVDESDGTTRMVVEIIEKLVPPTTRLAHILVSADNEWLFAGTRSTTVLENDEILVLVQECHDPMTAVTIQQLLRPSVGANPRTVHPKKVVGWNWGQFQTACIAGAERHRVRINPLALIKNGVPDPCPEPGTPIAANDAISIIVGTDFRWESFEESLLHDKNAS
ncbi:MAG: potassium channel family protein [Capsulimonadales bacterium]|nr:potassium channel family protein [Capsulimonadales bacterium]